MSSLIERLEQELDQKQLKMKILRDEIDELKVALEALKKGKLQKKPITTSSPKRGTLKEAVLSAIKEGYGTVAAITKAVQTKGINSSKGTISNTIQRLQEAKFVTNKNGKWVYQDSDKDK